MPLLIFCVCIVVLSVALRLISSATPKIEMPHRLIAGPSGTGKTVYIVQEVYKIIERGMWCTVGLPHEQAGHELIGELYARFGKGILKRLHVINIPDMTAVTMQRFIQVSSAESVLDRMLENDLHAEAFMETVARRRSDIKDMAEKPVLEKYTKLAAKLAQYQSEWFPEWWLPYAFVPKHEIHKYLVSHCADDETRREFAAFVSFPMREQLSILDPIFRLLSGVLGSPAVIARTTKPATFDKKAHLENGGITIILGGASEHATSVIIGSDFQETMTLARKGLKRQGVYIVDEAINYKLIGNYESKMLSTIRWKGVSIWYVVQSFDFPSEEIQSNVLQNTDHVWFRQGTAKMAREAAEDMMGAINEYKVHHKEKTTRQVHLGFEEVKRKAKGISKNHDGHQTHTENESESIIPIYGEKIEEREVYQSPNDQLLWFAQKLQQLPVGTCWIREKDRAPYQFAVPYTGDSWGFPGLRERKTAECLSLLKQRETNVVPEIRWPEPVKKATTKGGGSVMKPS